MPEFNLQNAIKTWKKQLGKFPQLEPGDIAELENHLLEAIDRHLKNDLDEEAAFKKAASSIEKGFEETLSEYAYSSASHEPRSKWFSTWWIPTLFPNILKVTLRNFKRQPGYSFINISGLAIGMACCLLIFLYLKDELSYDTFHTNADRIYRVDQTAIWNDFDGRFSSTGPGVALSLKADFPEIETIVRVNNLVDQLITIQHGSENVRYFEEPRALTADSTFFDVFSMHFTEGSPEAALKRPFSIVLTERTSQRYFNGEPALGKTILMGNPGEEVGFQVTGVVKELPKNSHFTFDLLTSFSNEQIKEREDTWIWTVFVTYILLNEQVSPDNFQQKLQVNIPKYGAQHIYPAFNMDATTALNTQKNYELFLTPLTGIHFNVNESGNRIGVVSDIFYVYVFSSIAILIILLAGINFMNLSTARSVHRAKEVGIRKTLGSQKLSLIGQFLAEALFFSILAFVVALIIVRFSIAPFNQIAATQLSFLELWQPTTILLMIAFPLLTGLFAGLYPAFYLSSFNPIEAFKGKTSALSKSRLSFNSLRDMLVVFQFAISVMLISCSVIIYQQLDFLQNKNLGFNKEYVIIIKNVEKLGNQANTFKQLIENRSSVQMVAKSNAIPPEIWFEDFARIYGSEDADLPLNSMNIDSDFIPTMGFELVKGSAFAKDATTNARYVLINETAAEQLPWPESSLRDENFPLGESIFFSDDGVQYEIIGVMKDFNLLSLHEEIRPLPVFHDNSTVWKGPNRFFAVRVSPQTNVSQLVAAISEDWDQLTQGLPFDFSFLDDHLDAQYETEQQLANVVSIFTGLTIFIALLGLLGLISFSIEKRTKEIGVRKVMGATSSRIVYLLSKDTLKLVLISIILSIPTSWWLMEKWLQNFAYRVDVQISVFLLSGLVAMSLAWITLSVQAVKAAAQNPVKSLRSE